MCVWGTRQVRERNGRSIDHAAFFQVETMIRKELKIKRSEMSREEIKSLFRVLDKDGNGLLDVG